MPFYDSKQARELPVTCKNNDMARRARARAIVASPAVSVVTVVSIALTLTTFGPAQVLALAATTTPTPTATTTATPSPSPTASVTPTPSTSVAPRPTVSVNLSPTASLTPTPSTSVTTSPTSIPSPSPGGILATGAVPVDHHVLARIDSTDLQARYLSVDAPITDASQFQTLRVRFRIHNAGTAPITTAPQLEYRTESSSGYVVVPEEFLKGIPFRVDREWVSSRTPGGGTMQGPLGEDIAVATFLTGKEGGDLAMTGHHSMGANPDREITLPSASYTEQEFTVSLTMDAKYLTGYELRITGNGTMLAGTQVATIRLGAAPALRLSPGQQQGVDVGGPKPRIRTGVVR